MTIRAKLATAIVVAVAGLALTAGVGIWGMNSLGNKFDDVRAAGEAQALALELKYDITDFNGWQTAYGYDNGASRPIFLSSVARFREDLASAKEELTSPAEQKLLGDIEEAFNAFMVGREGELRPDSRQACLSELLGHCAPFRLVEVETGGGRCVSTPSSARCRAWPSRARRGRRRQRSRCGRRTRWRRSARRSGRG